MLKERSLWESLDAWSQLAGAWKPGLDGLTPQEAKARADACVRFLNRHPASANAEAILAYRRLAEAVARRTPGVENSPPARILHLFSNPFVENVWMVTVNSRGPGGGIVPQKHYSTKAPVPQDDSLIVDCLTSFNRTSKSRIFPGNRVASHGVSPQTKIADAFRPLLSKESKLSGWEAMMRDLVARILDDRDLEPILKVAMLHRVLDAAVDASEPLRELLAEMKTRIAAAGVDEDVVWMNPDTPNLERTRARARDAIEPLRSLLPTIESIHGLAIRSSAASS